MLPYLIVKRERAELGIKFQLLVRWQRASTEVVIERESFYNRMKALNLKGPKDRAAAETKREGLQGEYSEVCDSPSCNDDKVAEGGRNDHSRKAEVLCE